MRNRLKLLLFEFSKILNVNCCLKALIINLCFCSVVTFLFGPKCSFRAVYSSFDGIAIDFMKEGSKTETTLWKAWSSDFSRITNLFRFSRFAKIPKNSRVTSKFLLFCQVIRLSVDSVLCRWNQTKTKNLTKIRSQSIIYQISKNCDRLMCKRHFFEPFDFSSWEFVSFLVLSGPI